LLGPAVSGSFKSNPALLQTKVVTTASNYQNLNATVTNTIYYNPANFSEIGKILSGSGSGIGTFITTPYTVPATVKAGDAGKLGVSKEESILSPKTESASYFITSRDAGSLLVTKIVDTTGGFGTEQEKSVYRVDTNGSINLVSIAVQTSALGAAYKLVTYTFEGTPPVVVLPPINAPSTPISTSPAPVTGGSTALYLWSREATPTYLGCLNCNQFSAESICNQFGTYGSPYQSKSIWNQFGTYGSEFNTYSPWNQFSSSGPAIYGSDNLFYGYFTVNSFQSNRTTIPAYLSTLNFFRSNSNLASTRTYSCGA